MTPEVSGEWSGWPELIDLQRNVTEWKEMGNTGLPPVKNKKPMLQFTQDL